MAKAHLVLAVLLMATLTGCSQSQTAEQPGQVSQAASKSNQIQNIQKDPALSDQRKAFMIARITKAQASKP